VEEEKKFLFILIMDNEGYEEFVRQKMILSKYCGFISDLKNFPGLGYFLK
jgi:hypothetical protein